MTHNERARDHFHRREIALALEHFRLAVRLGEDPECGALERWLALMTAGKLEEAWCESDRVLARRRGTGETCGHLPRHQRFVWQGEPLRRGRLLVRCYHGLGDVIQFIRYATQLKAICGSVHVQSPPELIDLLQGTPGIDSISSLEQPDPVFDAEIELMEVPYAMRSILANIPNIVPYLSVKSAPAAPASERHLRVGLVWASGSWRTERSLPLSKFAFLNDIPNVTVVGLQRGPEALSASLESPLQFVDTDWSDYSVTHTAASIRNLDLVISTDTMVAHLAGAFAKPVWTLLPFHADWRWLTDRNESPWYPTMRLFRQPVPGDWDSVVGRVKAELQTLADYQRDGLRP